MTLVYPILIKKKINKITINNYKKQEKFILKNIHIIEVEYIESKNEDIPFDKMIWYIECENCNKKVDDYCWSYVYSSTNASKSLFRSYPFGKNSLEIFLQPSPK